MYQEASFPEGGGCVIKSMFCEAPVLDQSVVLIPPRPISELQPGPRPYPAPSHPPPAPTPTRPLCPPSTHAADAGHAGEHALVAGAPVARRLAEEEVDLVVVRVVGVGDGVSADEPGLCRERQSS